MLSPDFQIVLALWDTSVSPNDEDGTNAESSYFILCLL